MAQLTRPRRKNPLEFVGASRLTPLVKSRERGKRGGTARDHPRPGPFLFSEKNQRMENNTFKHIETLGQIAERVRLDVAMIAHRLEALQRNLENAPSPCNGRAVAKVVGDFVIDLRDAIAPLR